nr:major egg antigen [Hymenolepis microstoma]
MERQLTNFQPFDMFPFFDRGPGSWFRQMNEQMRRAHNQMMEFMRDSGMNRSFDDFWQFPSMADCFTKDENGRTIFRTKFNLQDFDPEDIEVRVENQTLSVHAKHVRRTSNSSSGQYFCRAMLLPDGIRTEELKSRLDKNGVLTVEAPAPSVNLEQLGPSRSQNIPIEDGGHRHRTGKLKSKLHKDAIKDNVRENQDGSRELNISLPVEDIYDQKDISIQCDGRKLYVEGDKGDDHFTRTFYIPEDTDLRKINAKLYNGVLTITGPVP